jgi:hypothetical protein
VPGPFSSERKIKKNFHSIKWRPKGRRFLPVDAPVCFAEAVSIFSARWRNVEERARSNNKLRFDLHHGRGVTAGFGLGRAKGRVIPRISRRTKQPYGFCSKIKAWDFFSWMWLWEWQRLEGHGLGYLRYFLPAATSDRSWVQANSCTAFKKKKCCSAFTRNREAQAGRVCSNPKNCANQSSPFK